MTEEMKDRETGSEKTGKSPIGVMAQFLGVVFFSLGLLNTMLTMKGGLEPDIFNYILIILGAVFIGAGVWRSRS